LDTLSDNALMQMVKNGDLDKMSLLFERYHKPLFGFLFRMTGQKESSEDMLQNVFLRMLKYRNGFAGTGEFKTWMYHLARNVLNDHFSKNKKMPIHEKLTEVEDKIEVGDSTARQYEKKQEMEMLLSAMKLMSRENRELLVLCRFQELRYNEIAQVLNISEGAVKVRVHRALGQLKECYLKITK
jgi:RNA polymerase sigma factor (sigma-70 family)